MTNLVSFGPFVFDHQTGDLARDGTPVHIGTRATALLAALVAAEGRPVAKDVLMAASWPGLSVEENNLSVQIAQLRKAMGPRADGHDWIATVARVGYRLASDFLATSLSPSVAVLPFVNLGGDPEEEYFADGVVEDIITALSRFRSFAVIARNSSFVYKGGAVDVRTVGQELGVRYVLEGSIRRAKGRLRITAQLVDTTTGAHIWARNFDGEADDIFEFQDRITEGVVALVEPRIIRAEIERSRRERPESHDTYDLFLRALHKFNTKQVDDNRAAIVLLESLIARDPGYAPALALAAHAIEHRTSMGWPPIAPDDRERSLELARIALAVGGDDPRVVARAGLVIAIVGREFDLAIQTLERALLANPNDVLVVHFAGTVNIVAGNYETALSLLSRAISLNPADTAGAMGAIAMCCVYLGRHEEAVGWAQRALAENAAFNTAYWALTAAYANLGRMEEAHCALASLMALAPGISLASISPGRSNGDDPVKRGLLLAGLSAR